MTDATKDARMEAVCAALFHARRWRGQAIWREATAEQREATRRDVAEILAGAVPTQVAQRIALAVAVELGLAEVLPVLVKKATLFERVREVLAAARGPVSLAEIAERAGGYPPTVHNYLCTHRRAGRARRVPGSKTLWEIVL